jgi:hypothetical protein
MKHKIWISITAVLLLFAICTVVSYKNYVSALNRVIVGSTVPSQIHTELTVNGNFYFSSVQSFPVPAECYVEEIMVSEGNNFEAGDPLAAFHIDDVSIAYYRLLLQRETLEAQQNSGSEAARNLASHSLSKLSKQIKILEKLLENDGILSAETSGQVVELNLTAGEATTNRSALLYGDLDGEGYFEWHIDQNSYKPYSDITASGSGYSLELKTDPHHYLDEKKIFQYRSKPVPWKSVPNAAHGMSAQIEMRYFSGEYRAVLPKNCIQTESDGGTYVFILRERRGALGIEYYVQKVGVTIEEQDRTNAAVLQRLDNLVLQSTRPLEDLEKVLVIDDG